MYVMNMVMLLCELNTHETECVTLLAVVCTTTTEERLPDTAVQLKTRAPPLQPHNSSHENAKTVEKKLKIPSHK